jgi:glycosyltransferase involved in cell wall biosynthesis
VLPTGLPPAALRQGDGLSFRRRLGIAPHRPLLLHVGRMAHEKNIPFLLAVTAALLPFVPDLLLLMAGEGPARLDLERRAGELGIGRAVRWVGYLDRQTDLLDCYAAADVFIFASRTETQGLVLLEAMAQGTPVVSTAVLGTRDVLAAGAGALVAPEEVEPFGAAVLRLLREPELAASLAATGRAHVQQCWSAAASAARLAALYEDVVGERALRPLTSTTVMAGSHSGSS